MAIKTVRFNKAEERILKKILLYYKTDFSGCIKELMAEKLEDLSDVAAIQTIREGKPADYLTRTDMDKLFK